MVTVIEQKDFHAKYSLQAVKQLASNKRVQYLGRRVQRDIVNLGHTLESVCECICSLDEQNYSESIKYANQPKWLDVYLIDCRSPTGHIDPLYIKLQLGNGCLNIGVASFHREDSL